MGMVAEAVALGGRKIHNCSRQYQIVLLAPLLDGANKVGYGVTPLILLTTFRPFSHGYRQQALSR